MENRISESEWEIMNYLWEKQELTQPQLMELLGSKWNKNTVHTFLSRLCAKGFVEADKDSVPHRYRPAAAREECVREERQNFLQRVYQGSVGRMVASFVRDPGLTKEEIDELYSIVETLREEKGKNKTNEQE